LGTKISDQQQKLLRQLPGIDSLMARADHDPASRQLPKSVMAKAVRETVDSERRRILSATGDMDPAQVSETRLLQKALARAAQLQEYKLQRVINATGVVIHTNLGRSCLAEEAIDHVVSAAGRYSNLEFDLAAGKRGSRYTIVEALVCELTGAEAAIVVNNNAGAVLLCLDTVAHGRDVVISRGELVEIGGSFRIPDVMAKSGARLKEVGTTNRTHPRDYEQAIGSETGLLLKVHTSNYAIQGFTSSVSLKELVVLGTKFNLPVMEDLGSGSFTALSDPGLDSEPTVQASVATGADVITFSGDKLLGGPQAGFIVGKKRVIDQVKKNPLTRALRIDKLTLAATEATLQLYRDEADRQKIPTLRMLTMTKSEVEARANTLKHRLEASKHSRLLVELLDRPSKAGGGSLPLIELPSCCVAIRIEGISVNAVERSLRGGSPPIIGRIENDMFIMDPRTLQEEEIDPIGDAIDALINATETGDQA
jgi:L-seryl-tRNA(Ser) seleniumtransferase